MNRIILMILMLAFLNGCGSDTNNENAFQPQIDAVDKAKEVEGKILDAASQQQQVIEQDSQ